MMMFAPPGLQYDLYLVGGLVCLLQYHTYSFQSLEYHSCCCLRLSINVAGSCMRMSQVSVQGHLFEAHALSAVSASGVQYETGNVLLKSPPAKVAIVLVSMLPSSLMSGGILIVPISTAHLALYST